LVPRAPETSLFVSEDTDPGWFDLSGTIQIFDYIGTDLIVTLMVLGNCQSITLCCQTPL